MHPAIWIVIAVAAVQVVVGLVWWRRASRSEAPRPASAPVSAPASAPVPVPDLGGPRSGTGTGTAAPQGDATVVVLVHGILGFSSIGLGRARVHYFRRVARRLESRNVDVMVAQLPMLGGVPARGLALLAQLDRLTHPRIVIVAHSLGGLDARWALARGALDGRVKALITIGTPHRGTPIADALARGAAVWLRRALARIGLGSDGVDWLTTERLATFNREVPDVAGVTYASIVCASSDGRRVHPLLRVTHGFLAAHGPSDGLVPAASQAWGQVVAEAEVDHWAQIGWSGRHDAAALVERALDVVRVLPPGPTVRALTA